MKMETFIDRNRGSLMKTLGIRGFKVSHDPN